MLSMSFGRQHKPGPLSVEDTQSSNDCKAMGCGRTSGKRRMAVMADERTQDG